MTSPTTQKELGAYYTPDAVAGCLVQWATRSESDRLIDPSCGDGRFIAQHRLSIGVEQNPVAAAEARAQAPWALIHEGDFFTWAAQTEERFDCAAGNPPFIRYQTFNGATRAMAARYCGALGVHFSGLSSSWAPFQVATASLLRPSGRMAFVIPAEIGHAPYAAPLLEYLIARFSTVQIVAVREKLFPALSEDCWLLYADGFGGSTDEIRFSAIDRFKPSPRPPSRCIRVNVDEWRDQAKRRLRTYLLPSEARALYLKAAAAPGTARLGEMASVGIGYVSGANDFFHLRASEAAQWAIPDRLLTPTVRNSRALPADRLSNDTIATWREDDAPILLLHLPKTGTLPGAVQRYLDTEAGQAAREGFKCRTREPWYSVPDVQVPHFFLSYMSGRTPSLVRNDAGATCTNSLHVVRLHDPASGARLTNVWNTSFVKLSCELEGHPLGGGMLKLEPLEAKQIIIPRLAALDDDDADIVTAGLNEMRRWRHYAVEH